MKELNNEYKSEFDLAVQRTKKGGYSIPLETHLLQLSHHSYSTSLQENVLSLFAREFSKPNGNFNLKEIKGQCLMVHCEMQKIILNNLKLPTIITIGYLNFNGKDMFKFESLGKHNITRVNEQGKTELGIHVWLTLPTYEILDLTFMAQLAYVNYPQERKILLEDAPTFIFNFGSARQVSESEDCIYHPMYVGTDILAQNEFLKIK